MPHSFLSGKPSVALSAGSRAGFHVHLNIFLQGITHDRLSGPEGADAICFRIRARNSSAADEKIWYFFQTISSPDSKRGSSGRKTRSLCAVTFRSLSSVTARPTPFFTRSAALYVEKMLSADVIVLATPVYFYSMDAQLKALIDRSVSQWNDFGRFKGTEFWHIITAADKNREMMSATLEGLRGFMRECMDGTVERGVLYGTGAYKKGEVRNLPVFREAYEAGRTC